MAYKPIESHEEYLKILENYKDYKRNTYQSMSLDEKINFFDGIHTDNVPMFDENGNELYTLWDYGELYKEFIQHPEMFSVEDISKFIEMLDDDCYQPSFMDDTIKVIRCIVRFRGVDGAVYLLLHLNEVPERGKEYGLHRMLHYLIADDVAYPFLKEAMEILVSSAGSSDDFSADSSVQELVRQIINDEITGLPSFAKYSEGTELERIEELKRIVSGWQENGNR